MKNHAVYLSPLAEFKLDLLLTYLVTNWGDQAKRSFLEKLQKSIDHLSKYPKCFQESEKMPGIYKCIITPQNSAYFRISDEVVEIITLIDNRQDREKIAEEINIFFTSS